MTAPGGAYDIAISGGGMVGASLAWALSALPIRVALIEAVPIVSDAQPSFDERTTALSRSSQRILQSIGIWPQVEPESCPIRAIHVSERGRFGSAMIDAAEQGVDELGSVVANRTLGSILWSRIGGAANVDVFCPANLSAPETGDPHISMTLVAGEARGTLTARLLVVADGARSGLRDALGILATERSYEQTAIVGNVEVSDGGTHSTAYERFTPNGPIALLPFRDGRFVFVMARTPAETKAAMALDDEGFIDLLQRDFGRRLGRFTRLGRRSAYPLSLVRAREVTAPRVVVIGNAAHGLHPVAGQGYNLGLRDVATIAEIIADAVRSGADPGNTATLARYAEWRRRDQRTVVAFTDGLIRLFGLPLASVGAARGIGLALFDAAPGAKRTLARHTMGMGGTLTRLARGLPL